MLQICILFHSFYIYILLNKVLSPKEFSCLKQYNLSYKNSNELNLKAIYAFDDYGLYYSFSNELGFTKVSPAIISNLLKNGWKTNSKSIQEIFDKPEQDKINRQKWQFIILIKLSNKDITLLQGAVLTIKLSNEDIIKELILFFSFFMLKC